MANLQLWEELKKWKTHYRWVDLTHELSPQTPHWDGYEDMTSRTLYDYDTTIFRAHEYTFAGQYGTHVDAPDHFVQGGRTLEAIRLEEMVMPLCVIDKSEAVKENIDYTLKTMDILEWEEKYGKIPEGAFVAFRSDWSKRSQKEYNGFDAEGKKHYPGWDLDAIKFLVEQRNIGAIGHETSDTDAPVDQAVTGFAGEYYILEQDRIQIEVMANLDLCPPVGAIIFCTFPKVKDGTGFPARCFALCTKDDGSGLDE